MGSLELEVGVELLPQEFANKASTTITVSQARNILKDMGLNVPSTIYSKADLDNVLRNTPRLSSEQIIEFVKKAASK